MPTGTHSTWPRAVAWLGAAGLTLLHIFVRPGSTPLLFGWLAPDLTFRIAWMLAAWVYLIWFARTVWKNPEDEGDHHR